tara:strand:+ start:1758 stop:2000 length:243 start_codon:yes stop_codon:yes gene_type:complete
VAFERVVVASRTPPTAEESVVVVKVVEPQKRETIKRTEHERFLRIPYQRLYYKKREKRGCSQSEREKERKKERKKTPNTP